DSSLDSSAHGNFHALDPVGQNSSRGHSIMYEARGTTLEHRGRIASALARCAVAANAKRVLHHRNMPYVKLRSHRAGQWRFVHAQEIEYFLVRLPARQQLEQLLHRLLRVQAGQAAAQDVETRHDLGRVELLLLARAALRDVDRRVDASLGQLARQVDLAVP